jgi:hypothetical protein
MAAMVESPWPEITDETYIHLVRQFVKQSENIHRMDLRSTKKGHISCKFSCLAFLLAGIAIMLPEDEGDDLLSKNESRVREINKLKIFMNKNFDTKYLQHIFIENRRPLTGESNIISRFEDIEFRHQEDGMAFLGIIQNTPSQTVEGQPGFDVGNIFHYFIIVRRGGRFFILSSYGAEDKIAIVQYETTLNPETFTLFTQSLYKNKHEKNSKDDPRIDKYMRCHFLDKRFEQKLPNMNSVEQITSEIQSYKRSSHCIVQFRNVLGHLQTELDIPVLPKVRKPSRPSKVSHASKSDIVDVMVPETPSEMVSYIHMESNAIDEQLLDESKSVKNSEGGRKTKRKNKTKRKKIKKTKKV